jgi:hypothetical protein
MRPSADIPVSQHQDCPPGAIEDSQVRRDLPIGLEMELIRTTNTGLHGREPMRAGLPAMIWLVNG